MEPLSPGRFLCSQKQMIEVLRANQGSRIQTVNLDHLRLAEKSQDFRQAMLDADFLTADGWPVVRLLRKSRSDAQRVTGSQFIEDVLNSPELHGRRWALYGGTAETASKFSKRLASNGQELALNRDDNHRNWNPKGEADRCRDLGIHHVLVAISQPAAEIFAADLHRNCKQFDIIGVGGAVEMATGAQQRVSGWAQSRSLEWMFRLCADPRRLFRRYVLQDLPFFVREVAPKLMRCGTDHQEENNGPDYVVLAKMLQKSGLRPSSLALTFGDVLAASHGHRRCLLARGKDLLTIIGLALPPLRPYGAPTGAPRETDCLLISAPHDYRSIDRIASLANALTDRGIAVTHIGPADGSTFPGWSVRDAFLHLHCRPRELFRALRAANEAKQQGIIKGSCALLLARWLCLQTARTARASRLLCCIKPQVVVTDYDRGLPGGPFAAGAGELRIPTVTLVHGDPHPVSYAPPLAGFVCFWNETQAEVLSTWSGYKIDGDVVGAYWKPKPVSGSPPDFANCLLIHTGSDSFDEYLKRYKDLIHSLIDGHRAVRVRPHPRVSVPGIKSVAGVHLSNEDLQQDLEWAHTVFCDGSTVALDAMASGRSVAVPIRSPANRLKLASLQKVRIVNHPDLPSDWGLLVPPDSKGWPFKYVGEESLRETADFVVRVYRDCGERS